MFIYLFPLEGHRTLLKEPSGAPITFKKFRLRREHIQKRTNFARIEFRRSVESLLQNLEEERDPHSLRGPNSARWGGTSEEPITK
jgi:hypothetical protein